MLDLEHFDMKGYIPASLMNMTIASETAKELRNLVNAVKEKRDK